MDNGWLTEGTAHRSPVQMTPVIHLLVRGGGDWTMWCSGGQGRKDATVDDRLCRSCRQLAQDAVADETLDARDVQRWM